MQNVKKQYGDCGNPVSLLGSMTVTNELLEVGM
jgi:hypothetical protein